MSAIEILNKMHNKLNNKFINTDYNYIEMGRINFSLEFINNLRFIFAYINKDLYEINMPFYKCAHNSIGKYNYQDKLNYYKFIDFEIYIKNFIKLNKNELTTLKLIKELIMDDETIIDEDRMCDFIF